MLAEIIAMIAYGYTVSYQQTVAQKSNPIIFIIVLCSKTGRHNMNNNKAAAGLCRRRPDLRCISFSIL